MNTNFIFVVCALTYFRFIHTLETKNWTYFVFAQQWPPAACLEVPPPKKCFISDVVTDWSIHGLWPTSDKGYPSFCNHSWHFQPKQIQSILKPLEAKWPNIFLHSSETSFWKHEWDKHGTCATSLKKFKSELNYFQHTLDLHDKYNIFQFLRLAGINPQADKPILLHYVENVIKLRLNSTVKLFCRNLKGYSYPILTSMYICFDKELNPIDCDKIDEPPCEKSFVYYLPFDRYDY